MALIKKENNTTIIVNQLINDNSQSEVFQIIQELSKQYYNTYQNNNTNSEIIINPVSSLPYTFKEQQLMKPSINDPDFKPNIMTSNIFGVDVKSREGSEQILAREDSLIMEQARLSEKKRCYRILAREEMKHGLIPMSLKQVKHINTIKLFNDIQTNKEELKLKARHSICHEIQIKDIDVQVEKKLLSKIWIKNMYDFRQDNDKYRLIVPIYYTKKDGNTTSRTQSMMKKEISSTLKINSGAITSKIISKDEYDRMIEEIEIVD